MTHHEYDLPANNWLATTSNWDASGTNSLSRLPVDFAH